MQAVAGRLLTAASAILAVLGCGGDLTSPSQLEAALVYGQDDRLEYFEVADPELRALIDQSIVALVPQHSLRSDRHGLAVDARPYGDVAALCPGEPFAPQPAAAFCSGVLVDWDLVLTASHCVRWYPLTEVAIVFDYHYTAPGTLALDDEEKDVAYPVEIVAEMLDGAESEQRLDYAWLRLDRPVSPPRSPAALRRIPTMAGSPLRAGDSVIAISATGGVPNKIDRNGRVIESRDAFLDYFVAHTDTFAGSSGGGAFDAGLALTGLLVRGQTDVALTAEGCHVTVREPEGGTLGEDYTYVHRALDGLCAEHPSSSLCRPDCGEPCRASPPPPPVTHSGCVIAAGADTEHESVPLVICSVLTLAGVTRVRRRRAATKGSPPGPPPGVEKSSQAGAATRL